MLEIQVVLVGDKQIVWQKKSFIYYSEYFFEKFWGQFLDVEFLDQEHGPLKM